MKCSRCGFEAGRAYKCDHTDGKEMCKECYQEIHWLLNDDKNVPTDQVP